VLVLPNSPGDGPLQCGLQRGDSCYLDRRRAGRRKYVCRVERRLQRDRWMPGHDGSGARCARNICGNARRTPGASGIRHREWDRDLDTGRHQLHGRVWSPNWYVFDAIRRRFSRNADGIPILVGWLDLHRMARRVHRYRELPSYNCRERLASERHTDLRERSTNADGQRNRRRQWDHHV
jgi:hypothetical protein